jgi:beta-glucosidase
MFADNFSNLEWSAGYGPCFGVTHVDRENDLKRTPKQSAFFMRDLMKRLTE